MIQKVGDILYFEFAKKNKKLVDKAKEIEALKVWDRSFKKICPEHQEKTMATAFKGGVLSVAVLTKEAADAVEHCRPRIIEDINLELGRKIVWWINCES
jgi:hypothetical protein